MNDVPSTHDFTAHAGDLLSPDVAIGQIQPKHLQLVVAIERESFEFPWSFTDFLNSLTTRRGLGIVATVGDMVVGYAIYFREFYSLSSLGHRFVLGNVAVASKWRRQGIGTGLVREVKRRMLADRWPQIEAQVRERNLAAQLFLRSAGFRMVEILRGTYPDIGEDAYIFRHTPGPAGDGDKNSEGGDHGTHREASSAAVQP